MHISIFNCIIHFYLTHSTKRDCMKTLKYLAIGYVSLCLFYVIFIQKYVFVPHFRFHFLIPIFKSLPDFIAIYVSYRYLKGSTRKWMISATVACALGDILLGISRYTDYIPALVAYLCGHILFTVSFSLYKKVSLKRFITDLFVIAYTITIAFIVIPHCKLGNAISVSAYIIVITTMAIFASFINIKKYYIVFIGACLFILSDSINAIDKFVFSDIASKQETTITQKDVKEDDHRVVNLSVSDSMNPTKSLYSIQINLLHIIISIYYGALFFIVFGFVYILNKEE